MNTAVLYLHRQPGSAVAMADFGLLSFATHSAESPRSWTLLGAAFYERSRGVSGGGLSFRFHSTAKSNRTNEESHGGVTQGGELMTQRAYLWAMTRQTLDPVSRDSGWDLIIIPPLKSVLPPQPHCYSCIDRLLWYGHTQTKQLSPATKQHSVSGEIRVG